MKAARIEKLNKGLVALLLLGMTYLGLMLFLGTSSPFLLVRGASMEPTLHSGDLLLNKSIAPSEIKVGDVIVFDIPSDVQERLKMPPKATHRVIGIEGENGQMVFVTQGDNSDVDPFKVPSSMVRGVVVKNLGPLGWPILLLTNKTLLLFLGIPILTFALIVLATLWLSPGTKSETPAPAMALTLDRLTSAVAEYGAHLQSHTAIVKHMATTSAGLEESVNKQNNTSVEMNQAVHKQVEVISDLAAVVKELKEQTIRDGRQRKARTSGNGHKESLKGTMTRVSRNSLRGEGQ